MAQVFGLFGSQRPGGPGVFVHQGGQLAAGDPAFHSPQRARAEDLRIAQAKAGVSLTLGARCAAINSRCNAFGPNQFLVAGTVEGSSIFTLREVKMMSGYRDVPGSVCLRRALLSAD